MKVSRNALYGSLLLLPAAVLLWTFTYQPILGTIVDSLFSTARGKRAAVFVGLDQYQRMIDDPVFWKAISNNLIYALTTIPLSMALALLMALLVNSHLRGQAAVRMAYFTPTILPMVAVANIWLFFMPRTTASSIASCRYSVGAAITCWACRTRRSAP